ncbi:MULTISPECIES: hypothetical protein [Enterobacterales]|uniref:hypothetical protein n=1 Tax=Enterobacterales TaxID=91347 RepID=UPI002EDB568B
MATDIRWPASLPGIITTGKTRTSPPSYRLVKPRFGEGYRKNTNKNVPVSWSVTFKFSRDDAKIFWSWFVNVLDQGRNSFMMPIKTEFGFADYEVTLLPEDLLPLDESDGTFTYSAKLYSKGLIVPKPIEIDIYSQTGYYAVLPGYVEVYSTTDYYAVLPDFMEVFSSVTYYAYK